MAAGACRRGTKYSLCSSAPRLGVNSIRKCGSRSCHGPGSPSWAVSASSGAPRSMCVVATAGDTPWRPRASSGSTNPSPPESVLDFTHTWLRSGRSQSVKTLTL